MQYKYQSIIAFVLLASSCVSASEETEVGEARTGTINLSGSNGNTIYYNLLYVIPVIIAIILLDFAIFGTFASRSYEMNPISRFFYKALEGLSIIRNRRRHSPYGYQSRVSQARPEPQRVARYSVHGHVTTCTCYKHMSSVMFT